MPVDTYERGAIFVGSNGERYQLVRMFEYKGTNFFNLLNMSTGKMRRSDLTKSLRTPSNSVTIQELNEHFSPLSFTYEGRVEDYLSFPKIAPTPPTNEQPPSGETPRKSLWDEFMSLVDSIS
jgi:hypothetical protein